ncbi:MAG: HAD-IIA family hydrolase [Clostridia bacterium]|nr:HAD-IIA family hydrolase [Clostridia bacterium]
MIDVLGRDASALHKKKLFLLDMDGTVYLDEMLFDGVAEFLSKIEKSGGRYVFITNNSSRSVKDYVKKMHRLGLHQIGDEHFYTSVQAACDLLKEKHAKDLIYVQGTKSMVDELIACGFKVTTRYEEGIDVVLIGYDPELTGEKIYNTCKVLTKKPEIPYYATNPDWVCPVDFGYVPDCGAMSQSIFRATGREPIFIGKPRPTMVECMIKKYATNKQNTVVIGDRLYTDIASGNNAGVDTVCVLSGEVTFDEVKAAKGVERPTFLMQSVADIFK